MYRTAFLGCGPRAKGHARAYELVKNGSICALCDLNEERLNAFGEEFGVAARYTDFATMVEAERPDVVHMVTLPGLRVELLTAAVELGVPAVIVEKPLCCDLDDLVAIERLADRGTKIVVNHQLRYHERFGELLEDVEAGRIGPLRWIDGSCRSRLFEQGSHILNLMFALNGHSPVVVVQAGVGGAAGLATGHPSPDNAWAILDFANGVRASFVCGAGGPASEQPSIWAHKRVAAYGSAGHIEWWMDHWSKQLYGGRPLSGTHIYAEQDNPAQARLTEAVFDWLADETRLHATRLELAVLEARTQMAVYLSALEKRPVELPFDQTESLLPRLREYLSG